MATPNHEENLDPSNLSNISKLTSSSEERVRFDFDEVCITILNLDDNKYTYEQKQKLIQLTTNQQLKLIEKHQKSQPGLQDRWIYRIAVWALGLTIGVSTVTTTILIFNDKTDTGGLIGIGSAAVGALAGLLTPASKED